MKITMAIILALVCVFATAVSAFAEKGFETIYELYCDEERFGQPWQVYEMAEGGSEKICLAIFLLDAENDMAEAILIGAGEEGVNRYYTWTTGYESGSGTLVLLLSRFSELKAVCEEGVDFCVSFTTDGGQTMTDIDTPEKAEELYAALQKTAEDMKSADGQQ